VEQNNGLLSLFRNSNNLSAAVRVFARQTRGERQEGPGAVGQAGAVPVSLSNKKVSRRDPRQG